MNKKISLKVLFEDNHLLAVEKPAGILSQPDASGEKDIAGYCKDYLKEKYAKPGNVYLGNLHRLDRNVSGVMLFARTSKAAARMAEQFRERTVTKIYHALVEGSFREKEGRLKHKMGKDESRRRAVQGAEDGMDAELEYRVLENRKLKNGRPGALLEIRLVTGRFHQIRYQLSESGHPIVGDSKYGSSLPLASLALRCASLGFNHPISKERMTVTGPDPDGWPAKT